MAGLEEVEHTSAVVEIDYKEARRVPREMESRVLREAEVRKLMKLLQPEQRAPHRKRAAK